MKLYFYHPLKKKIDTLDSESLGGVCMRLKGGNIITNYGVARLFTDKEQVWFPSIKFYNSRENLEKTFFGNNI